MIVSQMFWLILLDVTVCVSERLKVEAKTHVAVLSALQFDAFSGHSAAWLNFLNIAWLP